MCFPTWEIPCISGIIKAMSKLLIYLKNVWFLTAVSLVLNIISWVVIATQIKPNSEIVPLHYNIFYGPDLVGKGYYIYFIPLVGFLTLVVNLGLYRYALSKEPFAAKTLIVVSLVVQILILISIFFLKSIIV